MFLARFYSISRTIMVVKGGTEWRGSGEVVHGLVLSLAQTCLNKAVLDQVICIFLRARMTYSIFFWAWMFLHCSTWNSIPQMCLFSGRGCEWKPHLVFSFFMWSNFKVLYLVLQSSLISLAPLHLLCYPECLLSHLLSIFLHSCPFLRSIFPVFFVFCVSTYYLAIVYIKVHQVLSE